MKSLFYREPNPREIEVAKLLKAHSDAILLMLGSRELTKDTDLISDITYKINKKIAEHR